MNATEILRKHDDGHLTYSETLELLERTCTTSYLAGAYLTCRAQRDACMKKAHDIEDETPEPKETGTMTANAIYEQLKHKLITQTTATGLLIQCCERVNLAEAYLDCRKQRDEWREQVYDNEDETPSTHLANEIAFDLIGYAYLANNIGYSTAYTYLSAAGYGGEIAETFLDELRDLRSPHARRENYLVDPDKAPRFCTICGRKVEANQLSNRGNCTECSAATVEQNLIELGTKEGPYYRKWRGAMIDFALSLKPGFLDTDALTDDLTLGDLVDHDKTLYESDPLGYVEGSADRIDHGKLPGCDGECHICPDPNCAHRTHAYNRSDDDVPDDDDDSWYCEWCKTYVDGLVACDCGNIAPNRPIGTEQPHNDEILF